MGKISYERCVNESVQDMPILWIFQKIYGKENNNSYSKRLTFLLKNWRLDL